MTEILTGSDTTAPCGGSRIFSFSALAEPGHSIEARAQSKNTLLSFPLSAITQPL
jgi:hypothetical protein